MADEVDSRPCGNDVVVLRGNSTETRNSFIIACYRLLSLVIAGRPGDGIEEGQSLHPDNSPGSFKSNTDDDRLPRNLAAKGNRNVIKEPLIKP